MKKRLRSGKLCKKSRGWFFFCIRYFIIISIGILGIHGKGCFRLCYRKCKMPSSVFLWLSEFWRPITRAEVPILPNDKHQILAEPLTAWQSGHRNVWFSLVPYSCLYTANVCTCFVAKYMPRWNSFWQQKVLFLRNWFAYLPLEMVAHFE